jgi:hypothetical protein
LFELIAKGGEKALEKIKEELDNDPKRFVYGVEDKNNLLNKANN